MKLFFINKKSVLIVLLLLVFLEYVYPIIMTGGYYGDQDIDLGKAVTDALIENGFCVTGRNCFDKMPVVGTNMNGIYRSYYEIDEHNREMFLFIVGFIARKGAEITGGAPIHIYGYHETHEEYRTSGIFFKDVKPFFYMEVNK
jgi:hypothetical protein